jgi:P27 family predicted phage terminase small subunit
VVKPTRLSAGARVVWDELIPVLQGMGVMTVADTRAFAKLCELEATAESASSQKDAPGFAPFVVSQDFNGADVVKIHAAIKLERETATALRPYYEYFGMTPSSRSRIAVPKAEEPVSKWAGIR